MPRFAANLTMLFNEAPFIERFERAAQAGFEAVEFLFPYDYPVGQLQEQLTGQALQLVLHNLPAGIRLLIEPINTYDIPGFFLNRTRQALEIIAEVGSDNLFVQYDIYHMQRMEGELAKTIEKNLGKIAHLQLADNPGRNEPGTGEINYGFLFAFLDKIGYQGWIGCEYKPAATTEAGLGWAAPYLKP